MNKEDGAGTSKREKRLASTDGKNADEKVDDALATTLSGVAQALRNTG